MSSMISRKFSDAVDFSDCKRYDFYLNRVLLTEKECREYVTSHNKEMCKFQTNGLTFNSYILAYVPKKEQECYDFEFYTDDGYVFSTDECLAMVNNHKMAQRIASSSD
jgi:hypothetical protein